MDEKIVEAVGTVYKSNVPGLGKMMEDAQAAAILKCYAEGITDPEAHSAAMAAARADIKEKHAALIAAEQKKLATDAAKG